MINVVGLLSFQHQPVTHKAGQRRLVTRDNAAERFIIFLHQPHDFFRARTAGEAGETAQIAEDHDDFGTVAVEQSLLVAALDEFGDLRREKPLQPRDALSARNDYDRIGSAINR